MGSIRKVYRTYLLSAMAAIAALVIFILALPAGASEAAIEQVVINKPEVKVNYRGAKDTPQVYLDGELLAVESEPVRFDQSGERVEYYVLLDISGSLSQDRFANIKASLQQFVDELRDGDRMILITFGEKVKTVLKGKEDKETAKQVIGGLSNNDMTTALFKALDTASRKIEKKAADGVHRLIICISDGEDIADNTKDAESTSASIAAKGIPVYTIAVEKKNETDEVARNNRSKFSSVATATGGVPWTVDQFPDGVTEKTANSVMNGLAAARDAVMGGYVMKLRASGNRVSMKNEELVLSFPNGRELVKDVLVSRHIADETAPEVTGIEVLGANELLVSYSEPVVGGSTAGNYRLRSGSKAIAVSQAGKEAADGTSYRLVLADTLVNGEYTIQILNVTDDSEEENALQLYNEPQPFTVTELETITEAPSDDEPPTVLKVAQSGEDALEVSYSEPVLHADNNGSYTVTLEDKDIPVIQVKQTDDARTVFKLTLARKLVTGTYKIKIRNVTDASLQENPLSAESASQSLSVEVKEPEKDNTPPKVKEVRQSDPDGFEITFSEEVLGADNNGNYTVTYKEKNIAVVQASGLDEDPLTYRIVLADPLDNGEYTIDLKNITDASSEKNKLEKQSHAVQVEGIKKTFDVLGFILRWWPIVLTIFVLILVILIVSFNRRLRKNKVTIINGVAVEKDNMDEKLRIDVEGTRAKGMPVRIWISNGRTAPQMVTRMMEGSMIVGRAKDNCDVYCNDPMMSKQHFIISYESDGRMYITDLGSTNKTIVNGISITGKTILNPDDEVAAGNMRFRFEWN